MLILDLVSRAAYFSQEDEATGDHRIGVSIDLDTWDDLGRPDQLTVIIEPGDKLND